MIIYGFSFIQLLLETCITIGFMYLIISIYVL